MVFLQSHRTTQKKPKILLVSAHSYTITRIIAINNFNYLKILVGIIKQKEIIFGIKFKKGEMEGGGADRRSEKSIGIYIIDE